MENINVNNMEQLKFTQKRKLRELENISKEYSENILYFDKKYDKLKYSVFIVILPIDQIKLYERKTDYFILLDNKSTLTDFFDNLGYCKAIKREIKKFQDIPLQKLKFDIDNNEYAIQTRKDYKKIKNIKGNPQMVIFTFRKNRKVGFDRQKSFKELIH
jgi:hypothetical protein